MKKNLSVLLAVCLLAGCCLAFTACESKPVLRLYNWYDYMDESILEEFEQ